MNKLAWSQTHRNSIHPEYPCRCHHCGYSNFLGHPVKQSKMQPKVYFYSSIATWKLFLAAQSWRQCSFQMDICPFSPSVVCGGGDGGGGALSFFWLPGCAGALQSKRLMDQSPAVGALWMAVHDHHIIALPRNRLAAVWRLFATCKFITMPGNFQIKNLHLFLPYYGGQKNDLH